MPRLRLPLLALALALGMLTASASGHFPFVLPEPDGRRAKVVLSEKLEPDPSVMTDRLAGGTKLSLRDATGNDTPLALSPAGHAVDVALGGDGTRLVHGTSDFGVRRRGDEPAYLLVCETVGAARHDHPVAETEPLRLGDGQRLQP